MTSNVLSREFILGQLDKLKYRLEERKKRADFWGLYTVCWRFGSWKTFYTHKNISSLKKRTKGIFIANYYSPDVDLSFWGHKDLIFILRILYAYKINSRDFTKQRMPVFIVIDEASLYYWNRQSIFTEEFRDLFVQLRKENITIINIIQVPNMLDKVFRDLCTDYILYKNYWRDPLSTAYSLGFWDWVVRKTQYYIVSSDEFAGFEELTPEHKNFLFWPKFYKYFWVSPRYNTNEFIYSKIWVYSEDIIEKLNEIFGVNVEYPTEVKKTRFVK